MSVSETWNKRRVNVPCPKCGKDRWLRNQSEQRIEDRRGRLCRACYVESVQSKEPSQGRERRVGPDVNVPCPQCGKDRWLQHPTSDRIREARTRRCRACYHDSMRLEKTPCYICGRPRPVNRKGALWRCRPCYDAERAQRRRDKGIAIYRLRKSGLTWKEVAEIAECSARGMSHFYDIGRMEIEGDWRA